MKSKLQCGGCVSFPENRGERVYMVPFFQKEGLPFSLLRWQPTVDAMLTGISTYNPIFIMIDQGFVHKGKTQRRPGLHVDGNWIAAKGRHHWRSEGEYTPETIILASNIAACRALVGEFEGVPGNGGECDHIDTHKGKEIFFEGGRVYRGNETMVHESLPVAHECARSLVRLSLLGVHLR